MSKRLLAVAAAGAFAALPGMSAADPVVRALVQEGPVTGDAYVEYDGVHSCTNLGYVWVGSGYSADGNAVGAAANCPPS